MDFSLTKLRVFLILISQHIILLINKQMQNSCILTQTTKTTVWLLSLEQLPMTIRALHIFWNI